MGLVLQDKLLTSAFMVSFYAVFLAVISLSVLLLELALTRIFSIILWYDYAFMAISIAFFGMGIGSLLAHIAKNRLRRESVPIYLVKSSLGFAASIGVFVVVTSYLIPPSVDYLYLFYLASSLPFLFAGIAIALIFYSRPRDISRLYFIDLLGSAAAALLLDPLLRGFGAEYTLVFISLLISVTCLFGIFVMPQNNSYFYVRLPRALKLKLAGLSNRKHSTAEHDLNQSNTIKSYGTRVQLIRLISISMGLVIIFSLILAFSSSHADLLSIKPGERKGLYYQLANPENFEHLFTEWNSFSRIDVTRQMQNTTLSQSLDSSGRSRALAAIAIDADADTPVIRWNGTLQDLEWIRDYMDFLPYEISESKSTLVIGSGGGEDVLTSLAGGSRNITAVEINPLIIEATKRFGRAAGDLYDSDQVNLVIDEGRRYLSGTDSRFDLIVIKLVDSWAAQLAGGYALSENYLYTVEAFKQYLDHLNEDNGMLVMVRWNFELPRLMPLVAESLRQEKQGGNSEDIRKQILVVENRPGLYFESNNKQTIYPVLLIIKNNPFTDSEINLAKERVANNNARVIAMPGGYIEPPYDTLLFDKNYYHSQQFLLLLGTPIMALTVILFSILLSSGIGAYLSGKLFYKSPYKAVVVSIPLLVGIVLAYYGFLQGIIDSSIIMQLPQRIMLTFALLSPAGLLMGFQFPSITRMASMHSNQGEHTDGNITLLWGINVIASVIATVLTAISSMVIGFNGNLLLGAGLYLGALASAIAAAKLRQKLTL